MRKNILTRLKEKKKAMKQSMTVLVGAVTICGVGMLCRVNATKPVGDLGVSTKVEEADREVQAVGQSETCETATTETRKIETIADADEFIAAFLGEYPEKMNGIWALSADMKTAVDRFGGLGEMAKQITADLGSLKKIGTSYEEEVQGMKVFHIPCKCSNRSVNMILCVQDGNIIGLNLDNYNEYKQEDKSDVFDSIDLALPVPSLGGELPGILTVPRGEGPFPAVVLIQGSGPHDKDETVNRLKPFRGIAEGLAKEGIAVYRFDKRTYVYGKQLATDKQLTLVDESIEDAVSAVQLLAKQKQIDKNHIFVLGHSLGGYAIPAIALYLEKAQVKSCGFIMMAAPTRSLDVLIREQMEYLMSLPEVTPELQIEKDTLFADLDKLKDIESLPEDFKVSNCYVAYWKWLAQYDVLSVAKEIKQSVLLLQGEEDYQVTMEDFRSWQDAIGINTNWTLKSYPGLTHLFVAGLKTEGPMAYNHDVEDERMDAQVISDIAEFVKIKKKISEQS